MNVPERIAKLRTLMEEKGIDISNLEDFRHLLKE